MGLSHNNIISMIVITKTDGQGAKKWHHINNGLNATGSRGAEELCQIVWQLRILLVTICCAVSDTFKNYAFPIDFMLKRWRKNLFLNLITVHADKFSPLSTQHFPSCTSLLLCTIHKTGFTFYQYCQMLHQWQSKQQRSANRISQQNQNIPKT